MTQSFLPTPLKMLPALLSLFLLGQTACNSQPKKQKTTEPPELKVDENEGSDSWNLRKETLDKMLSDGLSKEEKKIILQKAIKKGLNINFSDTYTDHLLQNLGDKISNCGQACFEGIEVVLECDELIIDTTKSYQYYGLDSIMRSKTPDKQQKKEILQKFIDKGLDINLPGKGLLGHLLRSIGWNNPSQANLEGIEVVLERDELIIHETTSYYDFGIDGIMTSQALNKQQKKEILQKFIDKGVNINLSKQTSWGEHLLKSIGKDNIDQACLDGIEAVLECDKFIIDQTTSYYDYGLDGIMRSKTPNKERKKEILQKFINKGLNINLPREKGRSRKEYLLKSIGRDNIDQACLDGIEVVFEHQAFKIDKGKSYYDYGLDGIMRSETPNKEQKRAILQEFINKGLNINYSKKGYFEEHLLRSISGKNPGRAALEGIEVVLERDELIIDGNKDRSYYGLDCIKKSEALDTDQKEEIEQKFDAKAAASTGQ